MTDIVCLGEVLIDMFPNEVGRPLVEVSAFHPKPGGAPANVAVAARRLGATSAFVGKVGDDIFGHFLITVLKNLDVETRGMRVDANARTTMAIIALPDVNHPEYVFYRNPGADTQLAPADLDGELLGGAHALHFGSLSLTDEPVRSATYEAIRLARKGGALISFDVNYRPSLWTGPEQARVQIEAMIPYADLVKVNEGELELLEGDLPLSQAAARLLERGPRMCVVTLGGDGSYFRSAAGEGRVEPFKVKVVDAVGCGDAFMGALLVQLTREGWSDLGPDRLHRLLRYANAVGAITAQTVGVIPALPTAVQVDKFLQAN